MLVSETFLDQGWILFRTSRRQLQLPRSEVDVASVAAVGCIYEYIRIGLLTF